MNLYDKVKEDAEWKQLSNSDVRLYVLVRGDLTKSQQAVQAGHAIAQFLLTKNYVKTGGRYWENEFLVLLKVKDLTDLLIWREKIRAKDTVWAEFREPDLNNQTTAVAAYGPELQDLLKNIPLL